MESWSVIIYCYNEVSNIADVIKKTIHTLDQLTDTWEIVIVNDGSDDGSDEVIKQFVNGKQIRMIKHSSNEGIGKALLTGYGAVNNEVITAIPADGEFNPEELLQAKHLGEDEFISFYRIFNSTYTTYRDLLSQTNRLINRFFLGLRMRDVNWVKVHRLKNFKRISLKLNSSLVESEICSKLVIDGLQLVEIPSIYYERPAGESKGASFKIVSQAALETMKLIFSVLIYRFKH